MGGHSFTVRAAGAMGPASAVLVTVQNLGPERAFSACVSVAGRQTASAVGCTIPRMGRGTLEIPVPDIGADSPMDVTAEVTVTAEDGASSSQTLRFKYLPRGWFDRLDPDLCSEIGRFATEGCTASDETGHLSADMRSAYGSLSEVKPRPETAGRYMRVSGPDEMRDFGDCTECEAAVAYIWERFTATCFAPETRAFAGEWEAVEKALAHRPRRPDSEAHRAFLRQTMLKLERLVGKYPNLALTPEYERLNGLLNK